MNIYLLGIIRDSQSKTIGFRLLDIDTDATIDASKESVKRNLQNGIVIHGIEGGRIKSRNYPIIVDGSLAENNSLIITYLNRDRLYTVYNWCGNKEQMDVDGLKDLLRGDGIANAKYTGGEFIGEFEVEKVDIEKVNKVIRSKCLLVNLDFEFDANGGMVAKGKLKERVRVPDKVTKLGEMAFKHQSLLEEIELPKTLREVSKYTFFECENLKSIKFKEGLSMIPEKCFFKCNALEEIEIPKTAKIIKSGAFYNCKKLKKVILGSRQTKLENGAIPRGVKIEIK